MGVILDNERIVYTKMRHQKFIGSSCWKVNPNDTIFLRKADNREFVPPTPYEKILKLGLEWKETKHRIDSVNVSELLVSKKRAKKETYLLNKKKVKNKCSALFGLRKSKKFLAFVTISFPIGMSDDHIMQAFNTFLTRCRKKCKLDTYLWVAERQANGTLHFHLLTNDFLPASQVNYYMARSIDTLIKKYDIKTNGISYVDNKGKCKISEGFSITKYNGVDFKRCEGNKKRLRQYLTKYVSKNNIEFFRLPYHSSRSVSELFTSETFMSEADMGFIDRIKSVLYHVETLVIDLEYCSVEYFTQKQQNGKYFNPPDDWYKPLDNLNERIYNNFFSAKKIEQMNLYEN